jgi:2-iminoacetate synthase ThiH
MPSGAPKYPLSELGHVVSIYHAKYTTTQKELLAEIKQATGISIQETSLQQAMRSGRGYYELRKTIMDYIRSKDPKLVEHALAIYDYPYDKQGGA